MATYPFLIRTTTIPPYWEDYEFGSDAEAMAKADDIAANGTSVDLSSDPEADALYIAIPPYAIGEVTVYKPK